MNIEKKLYQWDTEQKLTGCTGLYVDFPIGNEVYRVETADGTCIIPDELLQTSGSHKVYECMTNNTIRSFAFSVTPRPKPPDYVYTPTERLTFEGLVQRVDDAVADMIRRAESGEFDGHTPVKGTDYFTTGEIQQIQNEVSSGAIGEFKSVVDTETETFNTNAESKLTTYNENDVAKTGAYNTNASDKLDDYNTNASNKVTEYNSNAENKTAEFDTHTEQIQADISELKSDLVELDSQLSESIVEISDNVIGVQNKVANVNYVDGKYIDANGNENQLVNTRYSEIIPINQNTVYRLFLTVVTTSQMSRSTLRIHGYKNGVWVKQLLFKGYNESCEDVVDFSVDTSIDGIVLSGGVVFNYRLLVEGNKTISEQIGTIKEDIEATREKVIKSLSLSDIAVGNISYKDLFLGSFNLAKTNFNKGTISPSIVNAGNPIVTNEEFSSKKYSLKVFGTAPQQIKEPISVITGHYYYMSAMVNVKRYVSGYVGALFGTYDVGIQKTTDGFEKISRIILASSSYSDMLFTGSWSSANVDAYIDDVVFIDITTIFDNLDTQSGVSNAIDVMNRLHSEYISIVNSQKQTEQKQKKYVGVVLDANSSTDRFISMKELLDIAYNVDNDEYYEPTDSDFTSAQKGIVCELPTDSTAFYQGYPFKEIYSKNKSALTLPASTTKMVSLVTAMPYITSVMEKVTITQNDIQSGSGDFFYSGDVMTIEDLMFGMMLPSSNTCAMAFAHHIGKKILGNDSASFNDCISAFVFEMNRKATLLGCENSAFDTPSGLSRTNKTTASDLLRFLIDACSHNEILRVWNKKEYDINVTGTNPRTVHLDTTVTNTTLENDYYIFGGKTGSLDYGDGTVARALVMVAEHK